MTTISKRITKKSTVIRMLSRSKGARIDEIAKQTDWKTHTVRAFFTGLKKSGFELAREECASKQTAYRIITTPAQSGENCSKDIRADDQQTEQRA